eukprot:gene20999-27857_t
MALDRIETGGEDRGWDREKIEELLKPDGGASDEN